MLFLVKFVVSFFQQFVNMLQPSQDKYLTVKNRMHFFYNTQFVLCSATVQPFKSGNLCHYVYLQAKGKRAERSVSGGGILKGECFIFLQQNSLIFFHSGTKQTTTRTARQEQQKFREKECWEQNGQKKEMPCRCAGVCVCDCVCGVVEKKKMAAVTRNHWETSATTTAATAATGIAGKRETQTNVTQQFLWVWQKWIIRMDPGRRLFF